jgi:hypothetical protein
MCTSRRNARTAMARVRELQLNSWTRARQTANEKLYHKRDEESSGGIAQMEIWLSSQRFSAVHTVGG